MFDPNTSSVNFPDTLFLFRSQLVSTAMSDPGVVPGVVDVLHVNVTCTPCSLPNGHPAGAPATALVRFRLVPFGPLTKIRNVFPAFAVPKLKSASIRFGPNIWNASAGITFAEVFLMFLGAAWYFILMGKNYIATKTVTMSLKVPFYPVVFALAASCIVQCLVSLCEIFGDDGGNK